MKSSDICAACGGTGKPITEWPDSRLPVAIYARHAGHLPEESTFEAQIAACVKQAKEDGEFVGSAYIYQDQGSGLVLDRPGLGDLVSVVLAGAVRAVYTYEPSRVSRRPAHLMALRTVFESVGVDLRYVRCPVTGIRASSPDRDDSMGSSEPRKVKDELFAAVTLGFELANSGWDVGSIAALLTELVFQADSSKSWDASTLKGILEKWP